MQVPSAYAAGFHHARAEPDRSGHPLNAARGIVVGCALSACLWLGLVAMVVR